MERVHQRPPRVRRVQLAEDVHRQPADAGVGVRRRRDRDADGGRVSPREPEGVASVEHGSEHVRPALPKRLHELAWVRATNAKHRHGGQHGAREAHSIQDGRRQGSLAYERDHAGEDGSDLGGAPVEEGARLVAAIGRHRVDDRLPRADRPSLHPRDLREPKDEQRRERRLDREDAEGHDVQDRQHEHHGRHAEAREQPVADEERHQERQPGREAEEDAEEAGELVR